MVTGGSLPLKRAKNSEKIFIKFWLFYTVIIITAFTSKLTSVLMDIKYYKDYSTIDELSEAGLYIHAWLTQIIELQKAFNGTNKYSFFKKMSMLPPEYDHVKNSENNWTALLFDYGHPIILNTGRADWVASKKGVKNLFHIVKQSPIPNFTAFQVPAGSPLLDQMNNILRKIIESGLFKHWKIMQKHGEILNNILEPDDKNNDYTLQVLSLNHLNTAFVILFVGLSLSSLIFCCELIQMKFKMIFKAKRNKN